MENLDDLDNSFQSAYDKLNGKPFDIDKFFDRSIEGKQNALTILCLNFYIQEKSISISEESFRKEITDELGKIDPDQDWTKHLELIEFLERELIYLAASYCDSEIRNKKELLELRDSLKKKLVEIERDENDFIKDGYLKPNKEKITEEKRILEHQNISITSRGKNLWFLLFEFLQIKLIHNEAKIKLQDIYLLVAKTYALFGFLQDNRDLIDYAESLKTNTYLFRRRKKEDIYKIIGLEKKLLHEDYLRNKKIADEIIDRIRKEVK